MSENKPPLTLSARQILAWLVVLVGLAGSTLLATADYILGSSLVLVACLWVLRVVVLAVCWLLPVRRDVKAFGLGLMALSVVLDLLLKLPVLGMVEYGDWFLVSAMDLSGAYSAYFTVWGLLLPLMALSGWFLLARRRLSGWVVGLAAALALGFLTQAAAQSDSGTLTAFILLSVARYVIPAMLASAADLTAARLAARRA